MRITIHYDGESFLFFTFMGIITEPLAKLATERRFHLAMTACCSCRKYFAELGLGQVYFSLLQFFRCFHETR